MRKSFRIRTYDKPPGEGVGPRNVGVSEFFGPEGRYYKQATAKSAVQPVIFAV
jgi:hypothetical protein